MVICQAGITPQGWIHFNHLCPLMEVPTFYWIISRYMQLSLLPYKGQIHLLHRRYLRASLLSPLQNPKTWRRKSYSVSRVSMHFQHQKITTPTYASRFSTLAKEKSSRVCQEFSEMCVELSSIRVREHLFFLICHLHVTTTS